MPNVHPLIVHFPIALIFVIVACDFIGKITKKESFVLTGTILTVFAVLGAAAAVISGLLSEDMIKLPEAADDILDIHETLGHIYLSIMIVSLIFRFGIRKKIYGKMGWLAFGINVIAAGVVSVGGYLGGEMVFTYGAGVRTAQELNIKSDSLETPEKHREIEDSDH